MSVLGCVAWWSILRNSIQFYIQVSVSVSCWMVVHPASVQNVLCAFCFTLVSVVFVYDCCSVNLLHEKGLKLYGTAFQQ